MRLQKRIRAALVTAGLLAAVLGQGCGGGGDAGGSTPLPAAGSPASVIDATAPSVPQNLVATVAGTSQVNLTWSASTDSGGAGLAGYRILRGGSQIATTAQTHYSDTGLAAGTAYSYTVRAYDNANPANVSGNSSPPASVTTLALDTTAPTVPQNLVATAISPTQVNLAWSASTDSGGAGLAGYRVLRGGAQIASTVATNYSDTGLTASTAYTYTVRAYDNATPANTSADSAPANIATPATVAIGGLDSRPSNTTCVAGARPTGSDTATVQQVFSGLSFSSPILALQAPGDNTRWFVVQQGGAVRQFPSAAGTSTTTSFIDITARVASGGELGLLGMAFHPNFPTDRRVFLSYTAGASGSRVSRISAFLTTNGGQTLDATTERILLTLNQPEDNHNGGNIAFGPDGFLYIGFGDGGGGGDGHAQNGPIGNGQALTTMLGKILRIDIGAESAIGYTIPSTNPFAVNSMCGPATNANSCPEIYAYGVRNPWRWSFDRQNGQLWLGDVGQGNWEEVDIIVKGGNYGWRCREGKHDYNQSGCPTSGFIDPVAEYDHSLGTAITGGYVYRGPQSTALRGRYIFADYSSGLIWALLPDNAGGYTRTQILSSGLVISSFAQADDGELYVVAYNSGLFYRLVFQAGAGGGTIPASLAATGCVDATNPTLPAAGLIPYSVNAPFWSDGAVKDRWIALPNGQNVTVAASGHWDFPNGTVLMKNFSLGATLVETRLFMHHTDGSWAGYSYQWNDAHTDATLVPGGATKLWGTQSWLYPSESNCMQCHTAVAGRSLGPETAQMNRNFTYPQTGRTANQITTLNAINLLTPAIAGVQPAIPDPAGASGTLAERARSYLHTNCSQCHRPGGPAPVNLDLRYTTALNLTNACDLAPQAGDLGVGAAARVIAPGSAAHSVLLARVNRRNDANQMPPIGSNQIDVAGVALLTQWINALAGCN